MRTKKNNSNIKDVKGSPTIQNPNSKQNNESKEGTPELNDNNYQSTKDTTNNNNNNTPLVNTTNNNNDNNTPLVNTTNNNNDNNTPLEDTSNNNNDNNKPNEEDPKFSQFNIQYTGKYDLPSVCNTFKNNIIKSIFNNPNILKNKKISMLEDVKQMFVKLKTKTETNNHNKINGVLNTIEQKLKVLRKPKPESKELSSILQSLKHENVFNNDFSKSNFLSVIAKPEAICTWSLEAIDELDSYIRCLYENKEQPLFNKNEQRKIQADFKKIYQAHKKATFKTLTSKVLQKVPNIKGNSFTAFATNLLKHLRNPNLNAMQFSLKSKHLTMALSEFKRENSTLMLTEEERSLIEGLEKEIKNLTSKAPKIPIGSRPPKTNSESETEETEKTENPTPQTQDMGTDLKLERPTFGVRNSSKGTGGKRIHRRKRTRKKLNFDSLDTNPPKKPETKE